MNTIIQKLIKTLTPRFLFLIIAVLFFQTPLFAYNCDAENPWCPLEGQICYENQCVLPADILLPKPVENAGEEPKQLGNLPDVSLESGIATAIKTILGASILLTLVALVMTGLFYLQSQGIEEDITKAKNTIIYLIIGIAIMAAAYGFVSGVIQFDFFSD